MSQVNLGGVMPDGSRAQDLFVEASDFVCASGAMSQGAFTGLLGKLCLTRKTIVMLPYEGAMVEVAIKFCASRARNSYATRALNASSIRHVRAMRDILRDQCAVSPACPPGDRGLTAAALGSSVGPVRS
jgi:hypothetical protein